MNRKRRKFSAAFKAKVAIEALKERETIQQLASKYEIHANQISMWKREFLNNAENAFNGPRKDDEEKPDVDKLYQKIGELEVVNDFLKKSLKKVGL